MTRVDYIIQTPQGSEKHVLRFESCSEPWVAQQEFTWNEAAAVLGWVSSVGLTAPEMGAVALKRSRDPNRPTPPQKPTPQSKRYIIHPPRLTSTQILANILKE